MRQASQETGVPLPTLARWRQKGVFSAKKNGNGSYSIDASELDRIKAIRNGRLTGTAKMKPVMRQPGIPLKPHDDTVLKEQKIQHLQELLTIEREQVISLKKECQRWQDQCQRWQRHAERLLLTHQPRPSLLSQIRPIEWAMIALTVALILLAAILKA